ncbi:hypothetical protein D3C85_1604860 [compost metagenome]
MSDGNNFDIEPARVAVGIPANGDDPAHTQPLDQSLVEQVNLLQLACGEFAIGKGVAWLVWVKREHVPQ